MKKYREKIEQKGLKIKWIAMQLGIPNSSLSCYLTEVRTMPLDIEEKLKKLLYDGN